MEQIREGACRLWRTSIGSTHQSLGERRRVNDEKIKWARMAPAIPLSIGAITQMLEPWLAGREITDADLMAGGLVNRNFLLRLNGRPRECVLRIYDRDPSACAKEAAVLGLIGREVPVPRVLFVEDAPESGPPFAVLSVIDGISLRTLRSFGDDAPVAEAAFDAGRVLATLARYPGPPTKYESAIGLIERFVAAPLFGERVAPEMRRDMISLAERWQPRLNESAGECLVHGDFNSPNIFVKQGGDGWRVSGILDWEFALNASPYCDIGNFLRYHRRDRPRYEPSFSAGLRDGGASLPPDWLMLARVTDLPALCELLGRTDVPDAVVAELILLIEETLTNG
jgi:aminoglycoside phosphotransferase (APT) family kinase protein